jgi:glycine cleavage system H protein
MPEYLETSVDKFVFRVAADRLYSHYGTWAVDEWGQVRLGTTDYIQQRNGDVAFAHVKPIGTAIAAGEEFAELETVKANVSLVSPISGNVIEVNPDLVFHPEIVNEDPYGNGWLAVIAPANWSVERARLLDPTAYQAIMRSQAEQEGWSKC